MYFWKDASSRSKGKGKYPTFSLILIAYSSQILNQHGHDFQKLLEYNMRNSFFPNDHHTNEAYDVAPQRAYMNYVNDLPAVQSAQSQHPDPRFYDSPRKLVPPHAGGSLDLSRHEYKNTSPLQSPTDSESVFTDDDWVHNASFDNSKFYCL